MFAGVVAGLAEVIGALPGGVGEGDAEHGNRGRQEGGGRCDVRIGGVEAVAGGEHDAVGGGDGLSAAGVCVGWADDQDEGVEALRVGGDQRADALAPGGRRDALEPAGQRLGVEVQEANGGGRIGEAVGQGEQRGALVAQVEPEYGEVAPGQGAGGLEGGQGWVGVVVERCEGGCSASGEGFAERVGQLDGGRGRFGVGGVFAEGKHGERSPAAASEQGERRGGLRLIAAGEGGGEGNSAEQPAEAGEGGGRRRARGDPAGAGPGGSERLGVARSGVAEAAFLNDYGGQQIGQFFGLAGAVGGDADDEQPLITSQLGGVGELCGAQVGLAPLERCFEHHGVHEDRRDVFQGELSVANPDAGLSGPDGLSGADDEGGEQGGDCGGRQGQPPGESAKGAGEGHAPQRRARALWRAIAGCHWQRRGGQVVTVSAMRTRGRLRPGRIAAALAVLSLAYGASCAAAQEPGAEGERLHVAVRLEQGRVDLSRLAELGFEPELALPDLGRAQGWIAAERLDALRAVDGVVEVGRPEYALHARGSAISEGDEALGAAAARERFGVDGSGVRVAVISDGIRGLSAAQERGDAPQLVEALAFGAGRLGRSSEGTAMIELVHDLAPGAEISFGAISTDLDTIAAVRHFAQRVDVIVDDVGFLYPDDQQSEVSQNTAAALAQPGWPLRAYVTAAGNWAQMHWAGRFSASGGRAGLRLPNPGTLHHWAENEPINSLHLASGAHVVVALYWDEPWGKAQNDFDLYLLDERGEIAASSTDRQAVDKGKRDPREVLRYRNEGASGRFGLVVQNWRGAAAALELEVFALLQGNDRSEALEFTTGESSLLAQSDAGGGVITVAAITPGESGMDETAEYSSQGPTNNGAPKPDIAAIDGVQISEAAGFGARFVGTSAAAPHVAAVAALVLEAQPALLAADGGSAAIERRLLRDLLLDTAIDIGAEGRDSRSGAGRIDAEAAIAAARGGVRVIASAADRGAGTLRAAIEEVNAGEASWILFTQPDNEGPGGRIITLESPLPALRRERAVLDAPGWRIDARNAGVGLAVASDGVRVAGIEVVGAADAGIAVTAVDVQLFEVRIAQNGRGVAIAAPGAMLERVAAVGNRGAGVAVEGGGSGRLSNSWIGLERDGTVNGNGGPGVQLEAGAGPVVVGAEEAGTEATGGAAPIAPLGLPELVPRAGGVHRISGAVLIDGLPASGAKLNLWLDRRAAGSAAIDERGWFEAAVAGPGTLVRFSLNGVALDPGLEFEPGGAARVLLRASEMRSIDGPSGGNRIAFNRGGGVVAASAAETVAVRGNLMWSNGGGWLALREGQGERPRIETLRFERGGVFVGGRAANAATVDLYAASGSEAARYLATAPVAEGVFAFDRIDAGEADRFWVFGHDARGGGLGVSAGRAAAAPPAIASVTPSEGGYWGGERVTISGLRFRVGDDMPRVYIGGAEALVRAVDSRSIVVDAPATAWQGPTDVAVLRSDGRLAVLRDAFAYDELRRVTLESGWNTVTWFGPPTRITAAIAPIAQAVRSVFAWDAAAGRWLAFSPDVPGSLNTLRQLPGGAVLWVYNDSPEAVIWPQPLE